MAYPQNAVKADDETMVVPSCTCGEPIERSGMSFACSECGAEAVMAIDKAENED